MTASSPSTPEPAASCELTGQPVFIDGSVPCHCCGRTVKALMVDGLWVYAEHAVNTAARAAVRFSEPVLTIDPRRQFGQVCIAGTRTPAESVAGCVWAEGIEQAMVDYGVTREQALLACWWWVQDARLYRRKFERQVVEAWGEWADDEALQHLGGHLKEPCPEPPAPLESQYPESEEPSDE